MLPNFDEIYDGEKIGGCYLIFDVSLDSIPADLFPSNVFNDAIEVPLGSQKVWFFTENVLNPKDSTAISFEIPKLNPSVLERKVSFKIIRNDPQDPNRYIIVENLFDVVCGINWKPIRVDFYTDTLSALDRCYKVDESPLVVRWLIGGSSIQKTAYKRLFSLVDVSNTIPIWEETSVDPKKYLPIDTLDNVANIPDFDLSECAISFNRDVAISNMKRPNWQVGQAAFIEDPFKWRLAISYISDGNNKLVFEYVNSKGDRIIEEWWDGTKWTIPAGLIDMGKYGVPLIIESRFWSENFAFCSVVKVLSRFIPPSTDYATAIVLVQEAALRLGLPIPTTIQQVIEADKSVIDKNTQLLLGGLNSIAYYATTLYDWPSMRINGKYDVVDDGTISINMQEKFPGYDKMITDGFLCNIPGGRTIRIQQCHEDRYLEILNLPANEVHRMDEEGFNVYVYRGNSIYFARPLKKDSTLNCVYKTRFPVTDAVTGVPVPRFSNDKDVSYIDSELLVIGTVLNYKSYIGDDYRKEAQVFDEYAKYLKSTRSGNRIKKETESIPYIGRPDVVRII
jgi:hypothetical protein